MGIEYRVLDILDMDFFKLFILFIVINLLRSPESNFEQTTHTFSIC